MDVLVCTVGTSSGPIAKAIRELQPKHTYFIASTDTKCCIDGPGKPCANGKEPSILAQVHLPEGHYSIECVNDPNDPIGCWQTALDVLYKAHETYPQHRMLVNFIGGSKSMTAGLSLASYDDGRCDLSMVIGDRGQECHTVVAGTEFHKVVNIRDRHAARRLQEAERHLERFDYPAASALIADVSREALGDELQGQAQLLRRMSDGLGYWDVLEYDKALPRLRGYLSRGCLQLLGQSAETVRTLHNRFTPDGRIADSSGKVFFAPVYDLIRNAERRYDQERYYDAVARLYRAVELYAQIALANWKEPLHTGNIDVSRLPAGLQPKYERLRKAPGEKVELGLEQAYELLTILDHPVGRLFQEHAKRLRKAVWVRNASFIGHGFEPIDLEKCKELIQVVTDFVTACDNEQGIRQGLAQAPQFPTEFHP